MTYLSETLRQQVVERAEECCEYCLVHQRDSLYAHEVDHIIPIKHRGETNLDNLCLAYLDCNRHKGSDFGSFNPDTGQITALFNPHTQAWHEHFRLDGPRIIPLPPPHWAEGATKKQGHIGHTFQRATQERWSQMNPKQLYQWVKRSSKGWTGTTRHFQANVAHFSRGVVLARSGQLRKIAGCVGGKADSQRRRLQRFMGSEEPLTAFYTGWTQSVVQTVQADPVVLLVDETKLKDRWGVMVVGLAYQARCIPLASAVYAANDAAAYPEEGQVGLIVRLLRVVAAGLPAGTRVRVLADRGIGTSPALMRAIQALGWTSCFGSRARAKSYWLMAPRSPSMTSLPNLVRPFRPAGGFLSSADVFPPMSASCGVLRPNNVGR